MRILHIGKYISPVPGGIEKVLFELCSGLAQYSNIDVSCLVSNTKPETEKIKINGFAVMKAARFGVLASTPICPGFSKLSQPHPDLFHFHLPNPLATLSINMGNKPYVITYHCDIVRYKTILKLYMPHLKKFLLNAQSIIVSSPHLIQASSLLKQMPEKCQVIPFGIDQSSLKLDSNQIEGSHQIRANHGEKIVLFVGRLVKYKGVDYLIQAMKEVDGKLIIVGEGPEAENLKKLSQSLGLQNKVHFTGYIKDADLISYYQACKITALPSINESEAFGMCLLEALALGKPLLTTNLKTGVALVNLDGVAGIQVPVENSNAISQALNQMLQNENLYQKMSHNAKDHFEINFKFEKMISSHVEIYRKILNI